MKFRGPVRHQTGVDKELFLTTRCMIILAHLVMSQRCFLEEDDWKVEPWANNGEPKSAMDLLLDHFCDLPGILEDLKNLQDSSFTPEDCFATSTIVGITLVGVRIKNLVERLYEWRVKWEESFSSTYFSVNRNALRDMNVVQLDAYPFPTAIFFTEPMRVAELCLYNSILALLHRIWRKISASLMLPSPFEGHSSWKPHLSILLAPGQGSLQDIVAELCRLVYYQFASYPGQTGSIQLMFPLQVAYRSAEPGSKEAHWLYMVISHVADVEGFKAVRYSQSTTSIL
ncbi:hypothetical protein DTO169C6_2254 [Paecilomyces variotii]|nr:hypothetical protein DTO169C6_2254 [Paecilomyces variotii]